MSLASDVDSASTRSCTPGLRTSHRRRHSGAPSVSVVVAALNEAENLPILLPKMDGHVDEIILVDGASEDGTSEVAKRLDPRVRVVRQFGAGKGAALRTGFAAASGDIIVTMDADCSMDPSEIPAFVGVLQAGADYVKGSRFLHGAGTTDMPFHRRLGNGAFVLMVRIFFGGKYTDLCYGYNAFWREVLPRLNLDGDGFEIETVMNIRALRARLRVVEIGSVESERMYGDAKLRTFADGWRVLKAILKERFSAPAPVDVPDRAREPSAGRVAGAGDLPLVEEIHHAPHE